MSSPEHRSTGRPGLLLLNHAATSAMIRSQGLKAIFADLVERLEREFAQAAVPGTINVPPRSGVSDESDSHPSLVEWMPSDRLNGDTCLKIVGYHPLNPEQFDLPTILATISLIDGKTGAVKAILDGTTLTCLRTAAASVVASRLLANPASRTLGLIGCGAQAVAHAHGFAQFFPLERVMLHDVNPQTEASFATRARGLADKVEFVSASPEEIRSESDILCTATTIRPGAPPVFPDGACRPHLHVNAVGSDFPGKKEVPLTLLERALVIPDFAKQAALEGECQQLTPDLKGPELCQLSADPHAWRDYQDKLTVFDSTGWALEDQVVAEQFYELALEMGQGEWTNLEDLGCDPLDPYEFLSESQPAGVGSRPGKTVSGSAIF